MNDEHEVVYAEEADGVAIDPWATALSMRQIGFDRAPTVRAGWRYLLPIHQQVQLFWARLRGRVTFRGYRRLVLWSLLRPLLYISICAALITTVARWQTWRGERTAQELLSDLRRVSAERALFDRTSAVVWSRLAAASAATKHDIIAELAREPDEIAPASEILAHALVGLDPTGARSREVLERHLLPVLRDHSATAEARVFALSLAGWLRLDDALANRLIVAAADAVRAANDREARELAGGLLELPAHLPTADFSPLASALLERTDRQPHRQPPTLRHDIRRAALAAIAGTLDERGVQPVAALAMRDLTGDERHGGLWLQALFRYGPDSHFARALPALAVAYALEEDFAAREPYDREERLWFTHNLTTVDVPGAADALAVRVAAESDVRALIELARAARLLAVTEASASGLRTIASALLDDLGQRLNTDDFIRPYRAMHPLFQHAPPDEIRSFLPRLLDRMAALLAVPPGQRRYDHASQLRALGQLYGQLSGYLERVDIRPLVEMVRDSEPLGDHHHGDDGWFDMVAELVKLAPHARLEPAELRPIASKLRGIVGTATRRSRVTDSVETLLAVSQYIGPDEVRASVATCLQRARGDGDMAVRTGQALRTSADVLTAEQRRELAMQLVGEPVRDAIAAIAVEPESDAEEFIRRSRRNDVRALGALLSVYAGHLSRAESMPLLTQVKEYMHTAPSLSLPALATVIRGLSSGPDGTRTPVLTADDIRPVAQAVLARMPGPGRCHADDNLACEVIAAALLEFGVSLPADIAAPAAAYMAFLTEVLPDGSGFFARAWVHLQAFDDTVSGSERVQAHVNLLRAPYSVGGTRLYLVRSLEALAGTKLATDMLHVQVNSPTAPWRALQWADDVRAGRVQPLATPLPAQLQSVVPEETGGCLATPDRY